MQEEKPHSITGLTKVQVLAEIEDVLRTIPPHSEFYSQTLNSIAWLGRASAAVENWSLAHSVAWRAAVRNVKSLHDGLQNDGLTELMLILHQAQSDLRLKTIGPASIAIGAGGIHDYFDEVRKIIETATKSPSSNFLSPGNRL